MDVKQLVSHKLIQLSKRALKGTPLERFKIVSHLYRAVTKAGYGQARSPIQFRGLTLHIDVNDESIIPGLMNGTYEEADLNFIKSQLGEGSVVIDVGANIGIYTLWTAKQVGTSGLVYAFEPSPKALEILRKNVGGLPQVKIIPQAVGQTKKQVSLFEDPTALGSSQITDKFGDAKTIRVEMTTLDEIFNGSRLDFIKVDVEGGERDVLLGAKNILSKYQPKVLLEWNPYLHTDIENNLWAEELFSLFSEISYITPAGLPKTVSNKNQLLKLGLTNLVLQNFNG